MGVRGLSTLAVLVATLAVAATAQATVTEWDGSAVTSGSTYFRPAGIAISGGHVFVTDTDRVGTSEVHPRVVEFDPGGAYLGQWATTYGPGTAASDAAGKLYIVDGDIGAHAVKKHETSGASGTPVQFAHCTSFCNNEHGDVYFPAGTVVDSAGNVYVASSGANEVAQFSPGGGFVTSWDAGGATGIALAPSGTEIYVSDFDFNKVRRFGLDGTLLGTFASPRPGALATDSAGNVYVVGPEGVTKYDSTGLQLGTWKVSGASGIAVDSLGRVYVTCPAPRVVMASGGRVVRFDPSSGAPDAALAASDNAPMASQLVSFDAAGSAAQPFAVITGYEWDLDGNGTYETDGGTTPTVAHRFAAVGPATVGVRVTDSTGHSATRTVALDVRQPPTGMTATPWLAVTGDTVTFDASEFTMPLSDVERYEWDLDGNGSFETDTGTVAHVERSYDTPQITQVTARVTRSGGRTDTAGAQIEIRQAPPPGEVGVSINGGAYATNDRHVTLSLVWPKLLPTALISNDGGFGPAGSTEERPVAAEVPWTLHSAGGYRIPATVYVRFPGAGSPPQNYTDDIVLDESEPAVTDARSAGRRLRVRARDDNTGIAAVQVKKWRRGKAVLVKTLTRGEQGRRRIDSRVKLRRGLKPAWIQVTDVAGNKSAWRPVKH
jgi:sugar lactone lactonase YvrE